MAFLYDPGMYMPRSASDFDGRSWMISWPNGPWHLHDVEIGGTVLLVDAGPAQRIVWETRVTHTFSVPYEASSDLKGEILRRWGVDANVSKMVPGGFSIGWRAECVGRLDRGPVPIPDQLMPDEGEVLELTGHQQSAHASAAFRHRWGIGPEPEVTCTGRTPIGWFGPWDAGSGGVKQMSERKLHKGDDGLMYDETGHYVCTEISPFSEEQDVGEDPDGTLSNPASMGDLEVDWHVEDGLSSEVESVDPPRDHEEQSLRRHHDTKN